MQRFEEYLMVGQKRLRCGYTTGTCAAAAARAAAELLLCGRVLPAVAVQTPSGHEVRVDVEEHETGDGWAQCAVRKDAGDDPDVTDGILVRACVEYRDAPGIGIEGGEGVGRVTLPGLDQPVGAAAINSVPRKMIVEQIEAVCGLHRSGAPGAGSMLKQSCFGESATGAFASCGTARGTRPRHTGATNTSFEETDAFNAGVRRGPTRSSAATKMSSGHFPKRGLSEHGTPPHSGAEGLQVVISVPGGEEIASRTFNPRLGIEGGISIIGTSGIVKPMSEEALISSIELELRTLRARGVDDLLVVPGNYGRDFAFEQLNLNLDDSVQCSNYFGATLDAAVVMGFNRVLIVGHLGKMAKVAGGIMNTHSRVADCRMEVLAAHAALAGASPMAVARIMQAATTDAALDILKEQGLVEATMGSLMEALAEKLSHRVGESVQVEAIVFSRKYGLLGETPGAQSLGLVWKGGAQ